MTFKIGDKVQIVKRVTRQEDWDNDWTVEMNSYINNGSIYTINRIAGHGIRLKEDDNYAWSSNWVKNNPKQAY